MERKGDTFLTEKGLALRAVCLEKGDVWLGNGRRGRWIWIAWEQVLALWSLIS